MTSFAVVRTGQLLTLAGEEPGRWDAPLNVIADGAVWVEDGRIRAVGTTTEVAALLPSGIETKDCGGKGVVTPGFVDAHTHLPFAGHRAEDFALKCQGASYQEVAAQGGGIRRSIGHLRACADLLQVVRRRLGWIRAAGTVAAEVKSGYGLEPEWEALQLEAIQTLQAESDDVYLSPTFLALHGPPPGDPNSRRELLEQAIHQTLPDFARRKLCNAVDAFIEAGYYTQDEARELARAAKQLSLKVRLHVDQFSDQGGAQLAAELGCATADHLEHTSELGFQALAESGTVPVFLPTSVHALRLHKYPEAKAAMEAGLAFALATDFNPGSAPSPSMAFAMHLGCLRMGLSPAQAWRAATLHPAHALGIQRDFGSIEPGKRGAILFWELDDPEEVPYWIDGPRPVRLDL